MNDNEITTSIKSAHHTLQATSATTVVDGEGRRPMASRVGMPGVHDGEGRQDLRVRQRAHHLPEVPRQVGRAATMSRLHGGDAATPEQGRW